MIHKIGINHLSINKQKINWIQLNKFEIQDVKGPEKCAIKMVKVANNVFVGWQQKRKKKERKPKYNHWLTDYSWLTASVSICM